MRRRRADDQFFVCRGDATEPCDAPKTDDMTGPQQSLSPEQRERRRAGDEVRVLTVSRHQVESLCDGLGLVIVVRHATAALIARVIP